MVRPRGARAALALLLPTLLLGVVRTSDASVVSGQRLMVLGDSISQGFAGDWTWRNWLWREIERQGAPIDMVGPKRLPSYGDRYERTWSWDSDHASTGGATIAYQQKRLSDLLSGYAPQIVVVELGINDVLQGASAEVVSERLHGFVRQLVSERPTARVLLMELPTEGRDDRDLLTARANQMIERWARRFPTVTMVHQRTGGGGVPWDTERDTFDGLHPNATGQTLIAQRVAQALNEIGVLSSPPSVFRERDWAPDVRPEVQAQDGELVVSWGAASRSVRMNQVQVLVDGQPRTGWLRARVTDPDSTVIAVAPGTHTVQLVPRRVRMVARPGGAVTVTV